MERKLAKFLTTTFAYRSSSYLFYASSTLETQYTYTSTLTSPCTDNLGVFLGHLALKPCSLLSIRRGIFYLPRAHTVKWISQPVWQYKHCYPGQRFFAIPYRTVIFLLSICSDLYSMLVILPKLNCTQAVSTLWTHYSEAIDSYQ
jgi:hypothetical protein